MHRQRLITALFTLKLVFLIVFLFALLAQSQGRYLLDLGVPGENLIIMGFCVLSVGNVVYELSKV